MHANFECRETVELEWQNYDHFGGHIVRAAICEAAELHAVGTRFSEVRRQLLVHHFRFNQLGRTHVEIGVRKSLVLFERLNPLAYKVFFINKNMLDVTISYVES